MTEAHGGFSLGWIKAAIMRSAYDKMITKNGCNVKSTMRCSATIWPTFAEAASHASGRGILAGKVRFRYNENNSQLSGWVPRGSA
ncbi:hypothetical protein GCM10011430_14860 [Oxalicibacterium solurbis]|uniref:Uncharacterized protein n=1 Tax=Oxalicibacterium solurbis TaxID=69280 RepID=A0A8J3B0C0_9BURK|nr:hypothetical protein GCM10011430_14860 [Oxalicibacterium solurbis]